MSSMQNMHVSPQGLDSSLASPSITNSDSIESFDFYEDSIMSTPREHKYYPYSYAPPVPGVEPSQPAVAIPDTTPHSYYPSPVDSSSSGGRHSFDIMTADPYSVHAYRRPLGSSSSPQKQDGQQSVPSRFTVTASAQSPNVHFLLAYDSARANQFEVDMSKDPLEAVGKDVSESYGKLWGWKSRATHVRIVSREFPWVIEIETTKAPDVTHGVTCADIWNGIRQDLQKELTDADWAFMALMAARDRRANQRCEHLRAVVRRGSGEHGRHIVLRRLDWLMTKTVFVGLVKDDGLHLSKCFVLPGKERCEETWVAEFKEQG
ncbi:hypothetical protein DFH11DRAFT_1562719 [Phellopilus nigrolimitatus]|nr:hypothetical protein DFH11DRAFT_1562719 [Phellopilus nigrolimitatus]